METENKDTYDTFEEDDSLAKVELGLMTYILKLKGHTSRSIAGLDERLPQHNTIATRINWGKGYFRRLFPLMEQIKEFLIEGKMKRGEITLNLSQEELKKSLKCFEDAPKAKEEFPELYKMLQEAEKRHL